jgi:hypothetical protein
MSAVSGYDPSSRSDPVGPRAAQRLSFAMFFSPTMPSAGAAKLRRLAIAWGDFSVRARERSSPMVISLTTRDNS